MKTIKWLPWSLPTTRPLAPRFGIAAKTELLSSTAGALACSFQTITLASKFGSTCDLSAPLPFPHLCSPALPPPSTCASDTLAGSGAFSHSLSLPLCDAPLISHTVPAAFLSGSDLLAQSSAAPGPPPLLPAAWAPVAAVGSPEGPSTAPMILREALTLRTP